MALKPRWIAVVIACCLFAAASTADAAKPPPSITITWNCSPAAGNYFSASQAPYIVVYFYTNSVIVGSTTFSNGDNLICAVGGGRGRYKYSFPPATYPGGFPDQFTVGCFRSTIPDTQLSETPFFSALPASGTCSDDGGSGLTNLGPDFMTWSIR